MKPELKYEAGAIEISMSGGLDKDGDGKQSVSGKMEIKVELYELINEVSKKDMPLLEAMIAQIKLAKA